VKMMQLKMWEAFGLNAVPEINFKEEQLVG
jgi:hypothetical protein